MHFGCEMLIHFMNMKKKNISEGCTQTIKFSTADCFTLECVQALHWAALTQDCNAQPSWLTPFSGERHGESVSRTRLLKGTVDTSFCVCQTKKYIYIDNFTQNLLGMGGDIFVHHSPSKQNQLKKKKKKDYTNFSRKTKIRF